MSFLFPLYLLGAAAIALPILLHLRRRPPKDHVEFSSLMFLEKTTERLTRRTRIERWLLLALRCLALIILALMFGRPFLRDVPLAASAGEGRRIVVLVDASASMRRDDLWQSALKEADAALRETGPADEVAVALFEERLEVIRDFTTLANLPGSARADSFRQALDESGRTEPGWRSTRLGDALAESAGLIADAAALRELEDQEIVLISDFQEGADRDSLNRFAWPEDVVVRPVAVTGGKNSGNLALHLVAAGPDGEESVAHEDASPPGEIRQARRRVRLTNGRDSDSETYSLAWQGVPESKIEGFLPAGASRVMPVPPRSDETRDGVLEISGDAQPFDNRVYLARAQPRPVDILFLASEADADDVGSPLFYLSRAMHRTASIDPTVAAMTFESALAQPARIPTADVLVIRCDAATPVALGGALSDFSRDGGLVMAIANEGTTSETLQKITGIDGLGVVEAEVRDYAMLSGLDFEHPVLAPFARAQIRDFTKIHTWRHRELTLPEGAGDRIRVMARFEGGAPAWLDIAAPVSEGRATGRVFLFLSGWEPRESQLALSSKFVPLLYAMLGQAGFSAVAEPTRYVGHPIPLPAGETNVSVALPDGTPQTPRPGAAEFAATETPGFYTVTSRDALDQPHSRVYAINLTPSESRTEASDPSVALGDFGVRLESGTSGVPALATESQQRRMEAEEKEAGQKLWKWLVAAALAVLLIETWLAGRRPRTATADDSAPVVA